MKRLVETDGRNESFLTDAVFCHTDSLAAPCFAHYRNAERSSPGHIGLRSKASSVGLRPEVMLSAIELSVCKHSITVGSNKMLWKL